MLSPSGLYIVLAVILLVLGIIFLYAVIKKARRTSAQQDDALGAADRGDPAQVQPVQVSAYGSSIGLKLSFTYAMKRIRSYGRGSKYRIPWYLMLGEAQSGKTTVLSYVGLDILPDEQDAEKVEGKQGVNWYFFDQGIVLDVAGDFVLRSDGATSNVKGWNYLTKLLRRYRPERPLDGIILTIPCKDLLASSNQSPDAKFKLEQKAQCIYQKFVDVQKRLGLNLPVYVLITKCDEVTGFTSLCQEIPERRDEMFGWSSPYARGLAYSPEWVTEAFQNLRRYLFQLQIEVFAERDHVSNSDEFFMLPSEIRSMQTPLQVYLDQIFKESAYHEPFFLRGIYFCGDSAGEAPVASVLRSVREPEIDWLLPQLGTLTIPAPAVTPLESERGPVFLTHLFERKIFQEELLARPINRTLLSRNRWVRVAQVLSLAIPVIGLLGILVTYSSLKARERDFYNLLTREEKDLRAVQAERRGVSNEEQSRSREVNLFEAMSIIGEKSLVSPFIPGSWFSSVGENSGNSVSAAYPFVVLESLRLRLDCRTENMLISTSSSVACPPASTTSGGLVSILKCDNDTEPVSNSMHVFIENLNQLIDTRASYRRLIQNDNRDLTDLNRLLFYFNHAQVPATFDVHNPLFVQALKTPERPPLRTSDENVYDRAACKFEGMIQEIYDLTFKDQSVTYDYYLGDIAKTETLLARPKNGWLATRPFENSSAFRGMTISAGLSELKRALTDLSKEKFMSPDYGTSPETSPSTEPKYAHAQLGSALVWDKVILQQAVDLYKEYDKFVKSKSYNRRDTLDNSVKQVALEDFRRKFGRLIRTALSRQVPQRIAGESARKASLRVGIKNLEESQNLLSNLLDICRSLRIDVGLVGLVTQQTGELMNAINREFRDGNFYSMTSEGFAWWTSQKAFHSFIAFGASNPDELEVYLAVQRESIAELARQYAGPLVAFMSAQNLSIPSVSINWKAILDQLDKYEAKKPGNTVAVLENFIRTEMDSVKLSECNVFAVSSSLQPLDYFIRKRNDLRQPFYERCQQLALDETARRRDIEIYYARLAVEQKEDAFHNGLKSYADIYDAFNQYLNGKFPFNSLPLADPFAEATPDDINAFFRVFVENKVAATNILKEAPAYNISPNEALKFLDQLEKVRVFFEAFLNKDPLIPTFNFSLNYRENKNEEVGASQIIDWQFVVGQKQYTRQSESMDGIWGYGIPLSLSLRWAFDSPTIPASKFDPPSHMKFDGERVTLFYNNNWSLLFLLIKHRGVRADFTRGVDVEPYTIKIEIPTQPNPKLPNKIREAQPQNILTDKVKIFMRVTLTDPSKKDILAMPDVFPTRAPQLTSRSVSTGP